MLTLVIFTGWWIKYKTYKMFKINCWAHQLRVLIIGGNREKKAKLGKRYWNFVSSQYKGYKHFRSRAFWQEYFQPNQARAYQLLQQLFKSLQFSSFRDLPENDQHQKWISVTFASKWGKLQGFSKTAVFCPVMLRNQEECSSLNSCFTDL